MMNLIKYITLCTLLFLGTIEFSWAQNRPEARICGKWESTDNNLIITITLHKGQYRAIIDWFSDTEGKPLDYWKDKRNPDPALRSRTIHGMNIIKQLRYDPESRTWEDGMIYDSKHGKEWNAAAYIGKKGLLHVRGYWHFKFMGKTMTFRRI
ncbi:DUF2147 domain-containing protein [Mucilaginibacter corticis]|uniref:DUF2147 domain-containing protein n=1 Tax=Mucilaginibacter corticis TaxID=2597670 RepID=A0A556MX35_9SPHI|nr:DUF2147 domain-containing protein [Mucilaginibacter corticis]TSJ44490.1 DUF2147 domain-containing protein [Mucilaginibacter corticis]